jgi:hypothetical protein
VHSPGTWNCAATGLVLTSKAATTIMDRIIIPVLWWGGSTGLWPVEVVKPLFLPIGCLSLLPLEAFLVVLQCFKAGHEKLMYLT